MAFDIDGLLSLWSQDPGSDAEAAAAFGAFYTDPVVVNGNPVSLTDLVTRGATLRATFSDLRREILDVCEAGDKVAVAFRMTGHQTGVLATAAGPLPPTGSGDHAPRHRHPHPDRRPDQQRLDGRGRDGCPCRRRRRTPRRHGVAVHGCRPTVPAEPATSRCW
jgi:hypothetical protein